MILEPVNWNEATVVVLRELKAATTLTNKNIAEAAGISEISVKRYMTAVRDVKLDTFAKIARALGVDPSDAFKRVEARVQGRDI